jgi:hypothetical protein
MCRRRCRFPQQGQAQAHEIGGHERHAGHVAARPRYAGDPHGSYPIATYRHDDRHRRGLSSRRYERRSHHRHQDVDLAVDQLLGKAVEPIVAAFRPSLFKLDVPALDIAEIAEPLP